MSNDDTNLRRKNNHEKGQIFPFSEMWSLSKLCNESDWCAFFVLDAEQEYCKILESCTVVPLSDSQRTVYAKKQSRPVKSEGQEGSGSILNNTKSFLPSDDEDYWSFYEMK